MLFGLWNAWRSENWNNEYTVQFTHTIHCQVSPLSYTSNTNTILPENSFTPYSFTVFLL